MASRHAPSATAGKAPAVSRTHRLAWFIGLWCCGVGTLALISLLLRWLIHASFGGA